MKCYAKLACKYVVFGKGLRLLDGFGEENAQGHTVAQSHCAARLVSQGVVTRQLPGYQSVTEV